MIVTVTRLGSPDNCDLCNNQIELHRIGEDNYEQKVLYIVGFEIGAQICDTCAIINSQVNTISELLNNFTDYYH